MKSLQQEDRGLIQKEDQRRIAENKEPLPFIAISEYLTKFHQLKTKPSETFEVRKVSEEQFSEIEKTESDDQNHAFYISNQNKAYQPQNRPRFNTQRQFQNISSTPFRGTIRKNYSSKYLSYFYKCLIINSCTVTILNYVATRARLKDRSCSNLQQKSLY